MMRKLGLRTTALALAVAGWLATSPAWADQQESKVLEAAPTLAKYAGDFFVIETSSDDAEVAAQSEYWVGLQLGELPELVKSQLSLDYGLVTIAAMADSPALKAGLQQHDLLMKVGDKPLREATELVRAVNEAKDQKFKLTFLRHGKEQTIEIQPEKRPKSPSDENPIGRVLALRDKESAGGPELADLERALRALERKAKADERLGMWFVHPPILTPQTVKVTVKALALPDNVTVQVTKKGSEPATAVVKRGDQSWQVTEDKLDSLPEDLRLSIGRMLGKDHGLAVRAYAQHAQSGLPRAIPATPGVPASPAVPAVPHVIYRPGVAAPAGVPGRKVERREVIIADGQQGAAGHVVVAKVDAGVDHKLDMILKKLERFDGDRAGSREDRLDELQAELKRLRKEVERLHKDKE